jgi:hypothetical protein
MRVSAAGHEQKRSQSRDSKDEPKMCNSSTTRLRTKKFVEFSLKPVVDKSDAGIAPQCLQDAVGSGERSHTHCGVWRDLPSLDRAGRRTR